MNKAKVDQIFDLIERMSWDIHLWMNMPDTDVSPEEMARSRALLEEAGGILQDWKA